MRIWNWANVPIISTRKTMEACCSLVSHSLPCISLAGNRISGDPRRLGHGEFNLSRRPRKLSESLRNSSTFPRMALRSNVSEDTDDVFDDLIKKYGKVVFKRKDQKSPGEETNDDTESLSFAVAVAKVANEVKAADIRIDAIGSKIRDLAEKQYGKVASGDMKPNSWTLLDFGDVVVHIFLPEQRDFYNLEEFYGNATSIDLPFENQPPFRS